MRINVNMLTSSGHPGGMQARRRLPWKVPGGARYWTSYTSTSETPVSPLAPETTAV